jgi:general L-amino acid transport system permease protein
MLIAIIAFEAAYIAEVVRGGLQAVPRGQVEAAQAVGLAPWKTMRLIVLPQALRATIPAMVGQFISLFKDTTLVAVLGITELLDATFIVNSQTAYLGKGLFVVTLSFAALVFWVGCYTMSRESRRLERRLGVGER